MLRKLQHDINCEPAFTCIVYVHVYMHAPSGSILSWDKEEGEEIDDGDAIAQVETDKATMDMETPRAGYLAKIIVPAGSKDIPLGKVDMYEVLSVNIVIITFLLLTVVVYCG